MTCPYEIIKELELVRHPEGGWYRETWRADSYGGQRSTASIIYFLLEHQQQSHWHRVDAAEIWLWHAGHPIELKTAITEAGPVTSRMLGSNVLQGETPQLLILPNEWQAAEANAGWALVSCVVSPAFNFEGFTLAPENWAPRS